MVNYTLDNFCIPQSGTGAYMKSLSMVGLVLIILGVLGFAYQGITYTKREKVVDLGPIHATKDTHETIPVPPVLAGLAIVGGIVLMVAGSRAKN
jgi:hypothetical protein